jgi:hypothetical protein
VAEYDSVIPAGGSGKLVAKVRTRSTQNGKLTKGISVTTDAPSAKTLQLKMSFEVVAPIVVRPSNRIVVNQVEGEKRPVTALLHRGDGEPLEVQRVEVGNPSIIQVTSRPARAGQPHGAADGDVWIEVSVPPGAETGNRVERLKVHTNHPDMPVLELRASVRVRGLIEPIPAQVHLWLVEGRAAGRSSLVQLRHNRGEAFEIKSIEVTHPELFSAAPLTTDAQSLHRLKLELASTVDAASLQSPVRGAINLEITDPDRPKVEVPVMISKRTMRAAQARRPAPPPPPPKVLNERQPKKDK